MGTWKEGGFREPEGNVGEKSKVKKSHKNKLFLNIYNGLVSTVVIVSGT